jgi:NAD(P)-dependent dehydrogenase (short-subunit alcohol dehydrogenase family)
MLLKDKIAVIYGAGGAVGGAVARVFAREGATLFLTGRRPAPVEAVARAISEGGGNADTAVVDALNEEAVEAHIAKILGKAGRVDISFNALGIPQQGIQGTSLSDLSLASFMLPLTSYMTSHFLTARAAARRMVDKGAGVILMHTPEPARLGAPLVGGMGPAWAAMEGLSRALSAEFGPSGVRSVVLRTTGMPETATIDVVFGLHAKALGIAKEQFQALIEGMTHRRRSTTLSELADVAAFVASDRAGAMTGTVANLTGGVIVD